MQFPLGYSGDKDLAPAKALLRIPPGLYHQGACTVAGIKAVIPKVPDPPNPHTESGGTGTVSISQGRVCNVILDGAFINRGSHPGCSKRQPGRRCPLP